MKNIIILCLLIQISSCSQFLYTKDSSSQSSQKSWPDIIKEINASMEEKTKSFVGATKQQVVILWGPPTTTSSDGTEKGEVYSYSKPAQTPYGTYTAYSFFYFNEKGVCYFTKFNYTIN